MKDVHFCLGFVHDPGTFHAPPQDRQSRRM